VLCPYDGTSPPGCGSGSGTSSSDAGVSGSGSGAAQCVQISLSSYDQSCNVASDCTVIETGNVCSGSCGCGDTFINVSGEAQYEQAVSGITFGDCFCPSVEPQCVNNQCVGAVP